MIHTVYTHRYMLCTYTYTQYRQHVCMLINNNRRAGHVSFSCFNHLPSTLKSPPLACAQWGTQQVRGGYLRAPRGAAGQRGPSSSHRWPVLSRRPRAERQRRSSPSVSPHPCLPGLTLISLQNLSWPGNREGDQRPTLCCRLCVKTKSLFSAESRVSSCVDRAAASL